MYSIHGAADNRPAFVRNIVEGVRANDDDISKYMSSVRPEPRQEYIWREGRRVLKYDRESLDRQAVHDDREWRRQDHVAAANFNIRSNHR